MRVAIVEDEKENSDLIEKYLAEFTKTYGVAFAVDTFADGLAFLDAYKPVYDLLFLDIRMPYVDGMEIARRYSGWYAPAANIHRTPFGGRNWEYYSEDGMLSGEFAAEVIRGCASKGVYCCMKHFAVNDQETNRDTNGLITWVNEQSMREIYFKPFEIAVKKGGTMAMMSSFNRLGTVWAGGHYELLTSVLRNEWGFKGLIIDDYGLTKYINQEQVIRAGGDLMLIQGSKIPNYTDVTPTQLSCLRNATKHILYTVANSNVMEYEVVGYRAPMWLEILIIVDCAAVVAFTVWGVCIIAETKKRIKAR